MTDAKVGVRLIILAAQRKGMVNSLAARFRTSHKCLVPLNGKPLIAHVLLASAKCPGLAEIVVSIEPAAARTVEDIAGAIGVPVRIVPSQDNLADSIWMAAGGHAGPMIITTADHALLQPTSLEAVRDALAWGDAAVAMAREDAVHAAHPNGQRCFYQFREAGYSNCNLYGLAHSGALDAAEIFRSGGQFAKKVGRRISAFGLVNLLLLHFRLVTLEQAMGRLSRRIGLSIVPVILADGSQAIDIDNDRTHAVAAQVLNARRAGTDAAPATQAPGSEGMAA